MKNKFMMIRATEEEKNIANAKAQEMGMNLSSFVRFLIRQWGSPEKPQNQRESLLNRVSNQLAIRIARIKFFR